MQVFHVVISLSVHRFLLFLCLSILSISSFLRITKYSIENVSYWESWSEQKDEKLPQSCCREKILAHLSMSSFANNFHLNITETHAQWKFSFPFPGSCFSWIDFGSWIKCLLQVLTINQMTMHSTRISPWDSSKCWAASLESQISTTTNGTQLNATASTLGSLGIMWTCHQTWKHSISAPMDFVSSGLTSTRRMTSNESARFTSLIWFRSHWFEKTSRRLWQRQVINVHQNRCLHHLH